MVNNPTLSHPTKNSMKTINIYITKKQKKKADELRMKYKVSLSTMCGIVAYELVNTITKYGNRDDLTKLQESYIQKDGCFKTSVKPREVREVLSNEIKNKNSFTTNALIIYLEHDIAKYVNQEGCNKYWANIDKKLKEAYDIYWDYNCTIRNQRRMIRQNKEYWKKALEDA